MALILELHSLRQLKESIQFVTILQTGSKGRHGRIIVVLIVYGQALNCIRNHSLVATGDDNLYELADRHLLEYS